MEQFQHLKDLSINPSCRACLENLNEKDIHHDIFAIPDLQKKFSACSLLPVEQGDGHPTNLCELCNRRVNDFYIFQQMCISSRKRFQDYINLEEKPFSMEIAIDPNNLPKDLTMLTETKSESETEDDYDNPISLDQFPELVKQEPLVDLKDQVESSSNNEEEDMNFEDNSIHLRSRTEQKKRGTNEKPCHKKVNLSLTKIKLECEICKKRFMKSETFEAHMRVHQGLKAYPCEQCDKSYGHRKLLKQHIKSVHDRKLKCTEPGCDTIMPTKKSLNQHFKVIHLNNGKKPGQPYICEECGQVLKSLYSLKTHRFIHTGQLPHKCPHCNKAFAKKFALNDHINRHSGIKNFTCPQCGAKKATRSDLRNHLKSHNKETKYKCPLCDLEFRRMSNINHHRRTIHEGIKEFPCTYCDKTFATPKTRKHHEMTHTGEKPHECNICHKKFIQPYALKIHKKVHLKNEANEES